MRYLDFVQGWAVNCVGHSPGQIDAALRDQLKEMFTLIAKLNFEGLTILLVEHNVLQPGVSA